MTDVTKEIVDALTQENTTLKSIIEQLHAQKEALSSTVNEVLQANVHLKSGNILLEKQVANLKEQVAANDAKLQQLSAARPDSKKSK